MLYTVIVSEKEGVVCTLGGCHRWVSDLFWFSLKKCGLHSEKLSFNMHACVWPNDFAFM